MVVSIGGISYMEFVGMEGNDKRGLYGYSVIWQTLVWHGALVG